MEGEIRVQNDVRLAQWPNVERKTGVCKDVGLS